MGKNHRAVDRRDNSNNLIILEEQKPILFLLEQHQHYAKGIISSEPNITYQQQWDEEELDCHFVYWRLEMNRWWLHRLGSLFIRDLSHGEWPRKDRLFATFEGHNFLFRRCPGCAFFYKWPVFSIIQWTQHVILLFYFNSCFKTLIPHSTKQFSWQLF